MYKHIEITRLTRDYVNLSKNRTNKMALMFLQMKRQTKKNNWTQVTSGFWFGEVACYGTPNI